ncbi:MAG: DUF1552 domain-containing protein [Myxococcaceae bacterium]|nr:DUF1552 domain-containing protein [Myxococcaceae bacterium]
MNRNHLSRRSLLRGAGGALLALPFLESLGCVPGSEPQAAASLGQGLGGFPKRLIVFFTPDGPAPVPGLWAPTMSGSTMNLPAGGVLEPLAAHKQSLTVITGLKYLSGLGPQAYGGPHNWGEVCFLTGTQCGPNNFATGPSVDQVIAGAIGSGTRFKSLEFGVQIEASGVAKNKMIYAGAAQPLPAAIDPVQMYARIFGGFTPPTGGSTGPSPADLDRKSVLDFVQSDFGALRTRVSQADQQKLDAHLQSVRDLEQHIAASTSTSAGSGCVKPAAPTGAFVGNDLYPAAGKAQMDMLAMAIACDLTRVASIQWSNSISPIRHTWVSAAAGSKAHHDWTHSGQTAQQMDVEVQINRWYASQLGYLIAKLKAIPEGAGSVFDNTVILWGSEVGRGAGHSMTELPMVLAGSAGGAFTTGRVVSATDTPNNNLLVSLCRMFGLAKTTFGNPAYCTGPLAGLGV